MIPSHQILHKFQTGPTSKLEVPHFTHSDRHTSVSRGEPREHMTHHLDIEALIPESEPHRKKTLQQSLYTLRHTLRQTRRPVMRKTALLDSELISN